MSLFPAYTKVKEDSNNDKVVASTSKNFYFRDMKKTLVSLLKFTLQVHGLKIQAILNKIL